MASYAASSSFARVWVATKEANQLLAQADYDWSGRPRRNTEEAKKQACFEVRMVRTPTNGVNGRHR